MSEQIDYKELGKNIAQSMAEDGYIKQSIDQMIYPMLEKNKKEIIKESSKAFRSAAIAHGINCDEPIENQKNFAWLKAAREQDESMITKVREWSFKAAVIAVLGFFGIKDIL